MRADFNTKPAPRRPVTPKRDSRKRGPAKLVAESQELGTTDRERNERLLGLLAVVEANAARLGIDPEELYKPIPPANPHNRGK
jgi:hypothetical protein